MEDCVHEFVATASDRYKRCWKCRKVAKADTLEIVEASRSSWQTFQWEQEQERKQQAERRRLSRPDYADQRKASIDLRNYWK